VHRAVHASVMCINENSKMKLKIFLYGLLLSSILAISGCPRLAYLEIHNNAGVILNIDSSGIKSYVKPGNTVRMKFGNDLTVQSNLGRWKYTRIIPHSGENGPYFDGALKIQINTDGKIFALKKEQTWPIMEIEEQPDGYPLEPST